MKMLLSLPIFLAILLMEWPKVDAAHQKKIGRQENTTYIAQFVTKAPTTNNKTNDDIEQLKPHIFFIIDGIINPIICIIGMVSNIINMIVLTRRRMRSSTNLFLLALAIADFTILFVCCLYYIRFCGYYNPPIVPPQKLPDDETFTWWFYFHTWYIVANIFSSTSNWLILSVMINRFIAVRFPLQARQLCTTGRVRVAIVVIYVAAVALNLPDFFAIEYVEVLRNNQTYHQFKSTDFYHSDEHIIFRNIKHTLDIFIPWVACLVLTVLLIMTLKNSSERLRQISGNSQSIPGACETQAISQRADDQRRISRMLILLVIWFLVCEFPNALHDILSAIYSRRITDNTTRFLFLRILADVFLVVNYASNFFLYAASNQLYREVLVEVLTCRRIGPHTGPRTGTPYNHTQITLSQAGSRLNSPMLQRNEKMVANSQVKRGPTVSENNEEPSLDSEVNPSFKIV